MKKYILHLVLLISVLSHSQYGADGAVIAIGIGTTHALEQEQLDKIESDQEKILLASAIIALETAALVKIEKKLLDSYSETTLIEKAKLILKISNYTKDLVIWQERAYEIAQRVPISMPLYISEQARILSESTAIINDLVLATKKGNSNLLQNKSRLDIILLTLSQIEALRKDSYDLYGKLKTIESLNDFANVEEYDFKIDYDHIYQNAIENYNKFFSQ